MTAGPQLSVVVIGRNEGERLRRCLQSVGAVAPQSLLREIIYVDSASTDSSLFIAQEAGVTSIALTGATTAALARNAGWRAASGEFILFLDADTVLNPGFPAAALQAFTTYAVAVAWGHRREMFPRASIYNRVLDLDWMYPAGDAEFCGGDAIFRRAVLERTGGFAPELIAGEEPELCRRIRLDGGRILHLDLPMTTHDLAITRFSQYWRRAVRAGHAYAEVSARCDDSADAFWKAQARGACVRAASMLLIGAFALAAPLALHSWWPGVLALLLASATVLRTAWRARWKCTNLVTLLLYGIHSHVQQLAICAGVLRWQWRRQPGPRPQLLEYK